MAASYSKQKLTAGQRFGRLTAIEFVRRDARSKSYWKWRCDCGAEITSEAFNVKSGHTQSCGCLFTETIRTHNRSHGREYASWRSMRSRCNNPNVKEFQRYGKRGVLVCEEWNKSFEAFLADMGDRPKGQTLDRIDNDGNYEPGNCRWATARQQCLNQERNRRIAFQGRRLSISEWVEVLGIKRATLVNRLNRGWSVQDALGLPVFTTGGHYRKR